MFAVYACIATSILAQAPADVQVLGAERALFLDDHLIASMDNVQRVTHPAEKSPHNPVLWPSEPWEGTTAIVYGSLVQDEGMFKMWYHGGHGVSYAESADGIAWTRPELGIVTVDGQDTNIVVNSDAEEGKQGYLPYFYELFGVHRNPDASDAEKRYVMGYLSIQRDYSGPRPDPFHGGQRRGLGVAFSSDGVHWASGDPWATEAICDGATHWTYDQRNQRFLLYGRTKHVDPALFDAWKSDPWVNSNFWGRAVARVESPDFMNWNFKDPVSAPMVMASDTQDKPGDEIYSLQVFPYESVYIGLVQVFHNQQDACTLDVQLAVSHDSLAFERVPGRTPFIPCGPVGAWDRFNNSIANNPPIRVGDELRFYYGGRTHRHSPYEGPDSGVSGGGIGFATVKLDRLVSLAASFDGGVVVTKPLSLTGAALHANAKADFGTVTIEALGADGAVLATSAPVHEDGLDIPVAWADGELPARGEPVTFRIRLENAHLFALWCTD